MRLPQLSRMLTAIRHVDRAGEVLRCIRKCSDWPLVVPTYLGLRRIELPVRVSTRTGAKFEFEEFYDLETMWQIYCRGVYDVRSTDRVIVDAGANIGLFACYAANAAPHSTVHAIEPMPSTFDRLVKTIHQNGLEGRVHCYNYALSSRPGEAVMTVPSASQTACVVQGERRTGSVSVAATTLANSVEQLRVATIDLLKMDIEGSEYEVLQDTSPDTLRRFSRIVVEYHKPNGTKRDKRSLARHIMAAGFRLIESPESGGDYGMFHFRQLSRPAHLKGMPRSL